MELSKKQSQISSDQNCEVYNQADVVNYYAEISELQPAEKHVFEKYIQPDISLLDIGVGGGRTTQHLAGRVGRYVGIDYSPEMIKRTRSRFPNLDLQVIDASDMHQFSDASFDFILFSFNGIDCFTNDALRRKCLAECYRLLKPGGRFAFSRHNARAILVWPDFSNANPIRVLWRFIRALFKSIQLSFRMLGTKTFWKGHGYIHDPVHGGLDMHLVTPSFVADEVASIGFDMVETVPGYFPKYSPVLATPWYYYVVQKMEKKSR